MVSAKEFLRAVLRFVKKDHAHASELGTLVVTSCVGRSCFLLIQVGSHFCRSRLFKVLKAAGVSITTAATALRTLPSINSSEPQQAS